ncbi:MAG: DUF1071 domain-containing protein [Planctomycetes bacterium]|nr:DUF1071 domain-containing protein [Planctomycetota bacterium]
MAKGNFQKLYELDVNHKTESKNGLKYLSWAFAWAEFKKVNPDATYTVDQYDGKPYLHDTELGYLVSTKVTVDGLCLPMQLPVMDNKNKAMKCVPYQYKTRNGMKGVDAATMFDINTAIMRCLVKNLSMHGLGLYIYAGEDIPSVDNTAEIEDAINMIDQAITTNDVEYVLARWQGSIAMVWSYLGEDRINKLNEMAGI